MKTPVAEDFRAESEALYALIKPLAEAEFDRKTAFKGWTINNILRHLHVWNYAAELSLRDGKAFLDWFKAPARVVPDGGLPAFEEQFLGGLSGTPLLNKWHSFSHKIADKFAVADPKDRVVWAGPGMSVRSSITARLMESWAHGQAVYDELGVTRQNTDRIHSIVVLGVNTFGWSFKNRKKSPPEPMPFLSLEAPSGKIWTFGEDNPDDRIEGPAEDFCQVITQVRNIADVNLRLTGATATLWMDIAQCFAGPPETPPAPGTRGINYGD